MPDAPRIADLRPVRTSDLKIGLIVYGVTDAEIEYDEDDNEIPQEVGQYVYFKGEVIELSRGTRTAMINRFDGPDHWNCTWRRNSNDFGADCQNGLLMMVKGTEPTIAPKWKPLLPKLVTEGAMIATKPGEPNEQTGHIVNIESEVDIDIAIEPKPTFNGGFVKQSIYDQSANGFYADGKQIFINMNEVVKKKHFKCHLCGKMNAPIQGSLCTPCNSIPF